VVRSKAGENGQILVTAASDGLAGARAAIRTE